MEQKLPSDSDRVRDLVLKHLSEIGGFPRPLITDLARLDTELSMKSITFIEVQVALEEDLDIEIDALTVVDLNRLDRIIDYLGGLVAANSSSPNNHNPIG